MFAAKVDTGFGVASVGGGGLSLAPSGERVHIGFFGVRNAGKSSLVNAVCGQKVALASDVAGTTTDPVRKAMELLPLGPVEIIDTPASTMWAIWASSAFRGRATCCAAATLPCS